jgi:hypothetical protein
MSHIKNHLLTAHEQCLTLNTFIKNLPPNEKLHLVMPHSERCEALVETTEKSETQITVTAKNYNILRIRDYMNSGYGGLLYSI